MVVLFGASLAVLIVAALALAIGLAWGRPLLGGCRTRLVAGGLLPGCEACPDVMRSAREAETARGGSDDGVRA